MERCVSYDTTLQHNLGPVRGGASNSVGNQMKNFSHAVGSWFAQAFGEPTPVQRKGRDRIASGAHALLVAPTGSGKTLVAFLWAIDRTTSLPVDAAPGVRVVYVSPLKALVYDVERNLREPLRGIQHAALAHEDA
jgi:ATP-dependent Lhr-like helicase